MSTESEVTAGGRRRKLGKWLKLAGLAMVGLCTVSIPVTVALALSATGTSDLLTLGDMAPKQHHATPAKEVAGLRCVAKRGYYALTFDDGPSVDTTPRIVEALRKAKAVATFFDVGADAAAHPGLVELQRGVGQVANHGYSHSHLSQVSDARRVQELQAAAKVLDYPNVFFRAPFEEASAQIDVAVRSTGLDAGLLDRRYPRRGGVHAGDHRACARREARRNHPASRRGRQLRRSPLGASLRACASAACVPASSRGLRRRSSARTGWRFTSSR